MKSVSEGGRTVFFVSHNMTAVQSLCNRAICLARGKIVGDGQPSQVVTEYLRGASTGAAFRTWEEEIKKPGNEVLEIISIGVRKKCSPADPITTLDPFLIETQFRSLTADRAAHITLHIYNELGILILTTFSGTNTHRVGPHIATCEFPAPLLNSGTYFVKLLIVENGSDITFSQEDVVSFNIIQCDSRAIGYLGREPGMVIPALDWNVHSCAATIKTEST